MTDRKPDDLYDALHDRLADYGQAPPAALWAGIRAQLPPPVAAPQLRQRRRVPAAWLFGGVLAMLAVGAGWHWGRAPQPATAVMKEGRTHSWVSPPHTARAGHHNPQSRPVAGSARPPGVTLSQLPAAQTASAPAPGPAPDTATRLVSNTVAAPAAAAGPIATNDSQTAATRAAGGAPAPAGAAASGSARAVEAAAATVAAGSISDRPLAGSIAAPGPKDLTKNSSRGKQAAAGATREQASELGRTALRVADATSRVAAAAKPAVVRAGAVGQGAVRPGRSAATATTTRSAQALAAPQRLRARQRHQPAPVLAALAEPAAGQPLKRPAMPPSAGQSPIQPVPTAASIHTAQLPADSPRAAEATLPTRLVAGQPAAWPKLPAPQPMTQKTKPLPPTFASRWAVQVGAGPALTYRVLNSTVTLGPALSNSPPLAYNSTRSAYTPVATLERPALGSAAQVTVRRTLTGHWSLSAGLGYAEYANALALQRVPPVATAQTLGMDSAATSIRRRDTYRFATVPVRVGYSWTLSGRWRVGLLAGAEAAVYVGGSSTEGSPYRRLSLGASLGAEVRYGLGADGRWELLAQPMATYLLTPLAKYPPYHQRHLFGGAALLGVAFNLP